jgi:hypothetical protein
MHFIFWSTDLKDTEQNDYIYFFSCYWRKTTQKKHFTNLSSPEKCLLFLCPLMYSLIEEETIQKNKKSSYIPFFNDSQICNDQQHGN